MENVVKFLCQKSVAVSFLKRERFAKHFYVLSVSNVSGRLALQPFTVNYMLFMKIDLSGSFRLK
jgi:hypothetical protein